MEETASLPLRKFFHLDAVFWGRAIRGKVKLHGTASRFLRSRCATVFFSGSEVKVWNHLIWNPWKRITLVSKIAWPVILVSNSVVFVSFISTKNPHFSAKAYCGNPSQSIVAKQQHWVCGSPVTPDWTAKLEAVSTGQGPKLLLKSTCAQSLDFYVRRVHGKWQRRRGHSRTGGNTTHDWTLELDHQVDTVMRVEELLELLTTTPWKW